MIYVVNFVIIIKFECVHSDVCHACFNCGKCVFGANVSKAFPLTKTSMSMICSNDNDNNIDK